MVITIPDPVVHRTCDVYGLPLADLRPLPRQGGAPDGLVFTCDRPAGEVFVKIRPLALGDADVERERVAFVSHLCASGVSVPRPVPSLEGALVEIITDPFGTYAASVTERAPGRHVELPADWSEDLIRGWAAVLGRMHAIAAADDVPRALPTWRDEQDHFLRACRDDELRAVWEEFTDVLADLPTDRSSFGIVHNDLHLGNLLLAEDGRLVVLDFDVCTRHWFATDVATALAHPLWEMRQTAPGAIGPFVSTFLDAYSARHPLGTPWRERLPLFVRHRLTLFVLAMEDALGHPQDLPPWLAELRTWVLSGEPLVEDLTFTG